MARKRKPNQKKQSLTNQLKARPMMVLAILLFAGIMTAMLLTSRAGSADGIAIATDGQNCRNVGTKQQEKNSQVKNNFDVCELVAGEAYSPGTWRDQENRRITFNELTSQLSAKGYGEMESCFYLKATADNATVNIRPVGDRAVVYRDVSIPSNEYQEYCYSVDYTTSPQNAYVNVTSGTIRMASVIIEGVVDEEPPVSNRFFEDFSNGLASLDRFEFHIDHRDPFLVAERQWQGQHALISGNGRDGNTNCTGPDQTHTITRGSEPSFNSEWYYLCDRVGGDPAKAHLMTAIGDTSGYSIGSITPKQVFSNVKEVRWDINLTRLGSRQWFEVKVLPNNSFDIDNPPCGVPWLVGVCGNTAIPQGGVAAVFQNHELAINISGTKTHHWAQYGGPWLNPNDPAVTSSMIRRTNFLRDNGNGTLTYGIEQEDGTFFEFSTAGSFPSGDVRVVFADHNYTPHKDNAAVGEKHTWHWDNLEIQ